MTITAETLRRASAALQRLPRTGAIGASRAAYVALLREAVRSERDPCRRAMILFNAGLRGAELR